MLQLYLFNVAMAVSTLLCSIPNFMIINILFKTTHTRTEKPICLNSKHIFRDTEYVLRWIFDHAALVDNNDTAINHVLKNKNKTSNMLCMVGIIEGHFDMATSELFLCT